MKPTMHDPQRTAEMDGKTAGNFVPARRKCRRLAIWLSVPTLLAGVVSGFWAIASEQADVPKEFSASIAQFFTGAYNVKLDGSVLLYRAPQAADAIRISPTPQQWRDFRRALDEIDIWHWRSDYRGRSTDGVYWSLRIEYSDRSHKTGGYASFPEEAASPGSCSRTTTRPYTRFLAAVDRLLGDQPFGRGRVGPLELFDLAELRLVATHPSPNPREQWVAIRDPTGQVHRAWRHVPDWRDRPSQQFTYVGAQQASVGEVTPTSVSLFELCQNPLGEWIEYMTVMKKAAAP